MEDKDFEKYLKRIDEQYRHNAQFVCFHLITLNIFGQEKLKEILEEIVAKEIDKAIREFYFKEAKP